MYKFVTCVHGTTIIMHNVNERMRQRKTNHTTPKHKLSVHTWFKAGNTDVDGCIGQLSADVPTLQLRKINETSNTMRCQADVLDSIKRGVSGIASF